MVKSLFLSSTVFITLISCTTKEKKESQVKEQPIAYDIKSSMPHDTKAFTQGFVVHNGELFESTGQNASWIGIIDVQTGIANKRVTLPNNYFGEGITILNNKVYQLTWTTKKGFVYDLATFKKLRDFDYKTEGWGITNDSVNLIMSDGSDRLFLLDTTTLAIVKTINVTDKGVAVKELNELEYVNGYVYANIWQTDKVVKIDLRTGEVKGFLDLSALSSQARLINPNIDVLNGIAWHEKTKSFLVTGKYWPFIYVLKVEGI
jgi:glutaminyl-peptide cyclotransferase